MFESTQGKGAKEQWYKLFVSTQGKGAKEQPDKFQCKNAFVQTKERVWCQNKDYVGGATCWSSNSLYN